MKPIVYCMSPPLLGTADRVSQCILAFMPPLRFNPTQIKLATTLLLKETFDVIANSCATPHANKPEIDFSNRRYKYLTLLLHAVEQVEGKYNASDLFGPVIFDMDYKHTIKKLVGLLWDIGVIANENFNRHVDIVSIEIRDMDFLIYGNPLLITTAETKISPFPSIFFN